MSPQFSNSRHSSLLIFCVSTLVIISSSLTILTLKEQLRAAQSEAAKGFQQRPIYLPESRYVKLVTVGFDNFFGDVLWFNTINYFGKHYRTDQDYRWLAQMCHLTSELDNKSFHLYEFCATTLSWMAKEPTESVKILTRGISELPNRWRLRFLRGFNYWYFLDSPTEAAEDFKIAATLPEAPTFVANIASRLVNKAAGAESAILFLDEMIRGANDSSEKEALIEKKKLAQISLAKQQLEKAIARYRQQTGKEIDNLEQLFEAKILTGNLLDPFGGSYYLNKETKTVETTSGHNGLDFKGKTISTGLAAKEWKQ